MTKIVLHGILRFLYGKEFRLNVKSGFFAMKALDCMHNGFIKKIKDLHKNNLGYSMIIDGEWICDRDNMYSLKMIKQIDIVPSISGSFLELIAMVGLAMLGGAVGGASLGGILALGILTGGLTLLQMLLSPKPKNQTPTASSPQFVGGQSSSSVGQDKSSAFSNKDNISAQNVPVPLGYGRIRIGSKVIQTSVRSFPSNISAYNQLNLRNPSDTSSFGVIQ